MTTLEDVAKLAGVSIATVSYVINGTKSVRQETKLRVLDAIEQLNYIPNNSARQLRESNKTEIGIVFPHIDDPYYSEILKGIIFYAEKHDYSTSVSFSYNQPEKEKKIIQNFISRNVCGLLILTCQPDNTAFFQNSIIRYNIPTVFVDHMPQGLDVNFLSFDNYSTIYTLTNKLLDNGYEKVALFTGDTDIIGEYDCVCAFTDAYEKRHIPLDYRLIKSCEMTKEAAFTSMMGILKSEVPQAILSSSESITIGITEALKLCHVRIPEDTLIWTLGIECWNSSNYHPGILHTSRRAFTLGKDCTELLIQNLNEPTFFEKKFMLCKDHIYQDSLIIPPPRKRTPVVPHKKKLRIAVTSLPTIHALELIVRDFCSTYDVDVDFKYMSLRELHKTICEDSKQLKSDFDIYLFDVSWLNYLSQENCLMDLTDFVLSPEFDTSHIIKKNLNNASHRGRYYGIPIVGGTNLLFYRKDIFENISVKRAFQEQHNLPLRPPRTWTEFNGIAQFFTKEYNPQSPTTYGTAITGSLSEELFLELIVRLWSYGGGFFDSNNRFIINSPANIRGFKSILETCKYISGDPFTQTRQQTFTQFHKGDLAMFLSFTEYAIELKEVLDSDVSSKVGYCIMPGRTPANVGWHLGVSKSTNELDTVFNFFHWLCNKNISYYMTILNGQSVIDYPYHNHELLKLYPWLEITEEGISLSHSRLYPYRKNSNALPSYQLEDVLNNVFRNMYHNHVPISDALDQGQRDTLRLF